MDEELIVIEDGEISDSDIYIEDIEQSVEREETIELIEVEEPTAIEIEIEEAIGWTSGGNGVTHYGLADRNDDNQHTINAIEGLQGKLDNLGKSNKTIYSHYSGFAEFREWKNSNYGIGYFVSLVDDNGKERIDLCDPESQDVYGVTVNDSGFCGYQYINNNILDKSSPNKSNGNEPYVKVCLLGTVLVRFGGTQEAFNSLKTGDYLVPNKKGCADKSTNNIGFKFVSKESTGIGVDAVNWVKIALVPQNDNTVRVMEALDKTNEGLGDINIQLGDLDNKVNNNISIKGEFEELKGIVEGNIQITENKLKEINDTLDEAKDISQNAQSAIGDMRDNYIDALNRAEVAKTEAQSAYNKISTYEKDLQVIAGHGEEIVGFFVSEAEDGITVGNLSRGLDEAKAGLSLVSKSKNAIQHLVCSVDVYSVGSKSPTDGLSYDQAVGLLGEYEYIYVPIEKHTEKMDNKNISFTSGKSYKWTQNPDDQSKFGWIQDKDVSFYNEKNLTPEDGYELWYPDKKIEDEVSDFVTIEKTLYHLINGLWVAVATVNDKNARTTSLVKQTAESLNSTITSVSGEVASIGVKVDEINTTVSNVKGQLSEVQQRADEIIAGTYNEEGDSSQLAIVLNKISSTTSKTSNTLAATMKGFPSDITDETPRYSQPPIWDGDKYAFSGDPVEDGEYCLNPNNSEQYYKIGDSEYEIYIMGVQAITSLQQQVGENKSKIESFTGFDTATNETLTSIFQESDADSAEIGSIVKGEYRERTDIHIGEVDESSLGTRYNKRPEWNQEVSKFEFDSNTQFNPEQPNGNGAYCFPKDSDGSYYYKLLIDKDSKVVGYEKYEMKRSDYAVIREKVDENGSVIGLVAGTKDVEGSIFVTAINDQSKATIKADKISIKGTTTFSDVLAPDETAISGNYIRTGILTSNNYNGPVTNVIYGAEIIQDSETEEYRIIESEESSKCLYYAFDKGNVDYEIQSYTEGAAFYFGNHYIADTVLIPYDEAEVIEAGYVISTADFDLLEPKAYIEGTKFDLNNGTIYSRNLTLDRNSNLTIAGRITATSGYLGNGVDGFEIACREQRWMHVVGTDEIEQDNNNTLIGDQSYYFKYNEKYYKFKVSKDLPEGNKIYLIPNNTTIPKITIDGWSVEVEEKTSLPSNAVCLSLKQEYLYSLVNDQQSLWGDASKRGAFGVYLGPDGIGLGNGAFAVDSNGNLDTMGNITMWGKDTNGSWSEVFKVKNRNLTLAGNIILGGNITWSANNSPIHVLYAHSIASNDNKPSKQWLDTNGDCNYKDYDDIFWHYEYQTGNNNRNPDYWASYTSDGGATWTDPIRIKGEKGEDGNPGSNDVDSRYIFEMLTDGGETQGVFPFYGTYTGSTAKPQLYINAQYIYGQTVGGLKIVNEDADKNQIILDSGIASWLSASGTGDNITHGLKMKIGFGYDELDKTNIPFFAFGAGNGKELTAKILGQTAYYGQAWMFKSADGLHINLQGQDKKVQGIHFYDYDAIPDVWKDSHISFGDSNLDFTYATVRGLKITFG
jgi:hypothetical protein